MSSSGSAGRPQEPLGDQERLELFRLLVEEAKDYAIILLDPGGYISSWNPGAERIKGYAAAEIVGQHFSRFYSPEDLAAGKPERELSEVRATGRIEDESFRVRKDGTRFWANVIITALRDGTGKLLGFSKITRDLTERKRAQEAEIGRLAAEHANGLKDEFLALVGHELRNPLAPIMTAVHLLRMKSDGQAAGELAVIDRQLVNLSRLVDDLLDISRVKRGQIQVEQVPVDLGDAIAEAVEMAAPVLEGRGHHFHLEAPRGVIRVRGDRGRLAQVVANLLTNAARYTEPGGHVRVTLRREGATAVVEVRDDGVGIAPDLLPRIYDLFVQGPQDSQRAKGGLGLGLSLVRSLVTLHGGEVEARSEGLGKGSTFVVRLPVLVEDRQIEPRRAPSPAPSSARKYRVLLVDDNVDALALLGDVLRALGHEVHGAADAPAALEIMRDFRADVAILDIGLPVMDGYALGARLRAELGARAPRLVALTGYGQQKDRDRSAVAGFSAHLVKPIGIAALLAALEAPAPAAA